MNSGGRHRINVVLRVALAGASVFLVGAGFFEYRASRAGAANEADLIIQAGATYGAAVARAPGREEVLEGDALIAYLEPRFRDGKELTIQVSGGVSADAWLHVQRALEEASRRAGLTSSPALRLVMEPAEEPVDD